MTQHLTRQLDIIPLEALNVRINVIGAGAIGSFTCLQLAKMGFEDLHSWDDDTVSIENMNSQFYRFKDIDTPKVEALKSLVKDFTNTEITAHNSKYESDCLDGIVICAVDSMDARKKIFQEHRLVAAGTKLIIDPRMSAEFANLYAYKPCDEKDVDFYENTLYSNDQAVQERCTEKATIYTSNLLSGLVTKTVKDFVTKNTYLRNVSWDIKSFALEAWNSEKKNPNQQVPLAGNVPMFTESVDTGAELTGEERIALSDTEHSQDAIGYGLSAEWEQQREFVRVDPRRMRDMQESVNRVASQIIDNQEPSANEVQVRREIENRVAFLEGRRFGRTPQLPEIFARAIRGIEALRPEQVMEVEEATVSYFANVERSNDE